MKIRLRKPKPTKRRKEVYLIPEVIFKLEGKARYEGRKLKNYMEKVLINDSEIPPKD